MSLSMHTLRNIHPYIQNLKKDAIVIKPCNRIKFIIKLVDCKTFLLDFMSALSIKNVSGMNTMDTLKFRKPCSVAVTKINLSVELSVSFNSSLNST